MGGLVASRFTETEAGRAVIALDTDALVRHPVDDDAKQQCV